MANPHEPPATKFRFTVVIDANSHEEIERELNQLANGGYLRDSQGYSRDSFHCVGGRAGRRLEHVSPDTTPATFERDLAEWWEARKADRKADGSGS